MWYITSVSCKNTCNSTLNRFSFSGQKIAYLSLLRKNEDGYFVPLLIKTNYITLIIIPILLKPSLDYTSRLLFLNHFLNTLKKFFSSFIYWAIHKLEKTNYTATSFGISQSHILNVITSMLNIKLLIHWWLFCISATAFIFSSV